MWIVRVALQRPYTILPGSYAQVHLQLPIERGLRLPVNTLIFRAEGLQVATVLSDNRIALKNIELGRDYGTEVQVVAGLDSDAAVVLNPPDGLRQSQLVKVAVPPANTAETSSH